MGRLDLRYNRVIFAHCAFVSSDDSQSMHGTPFNAYYSRGVPIMLPPMRRGYDTASTSFNRLAKVLLDYSEIGGRW
jgi:hypothetical protein